MNMVELSQRLRRLRLERGLTLEEVASRSGLTRGWLSKVENFRVTPSLPALYRVASGLGVTLAQLFEGLDDRPPLSVVRRHERVRLRRDEDLSELVYESLAHKRPSRNMDPFMITVPRSDHRAVMAHPGEEFLLVLRGQIELEHGDEHIVLGEGDSAYFDGLVPHRVICRSDDDAEVLVVYYGDDVRSDEDTGAGAFEAEAVK